MDRNRPGALQRLILGLLLGTLVLTGVLALSAVNAQRAHQRAADRTLENLASVSAWELGRLLDAHVEASLFAAFSGVVNNWYRRDRAPTGPPPLPVFANAVASRGDVCHCLGGVLTYFALDLATGSLATRPVGPHDARSVSWVPDSLRAYLRTAPEGAEAASGVKRLNGPAGRVARLRHTPFRDAIQFSDVGGMPLVAAFVVTRTRDGAPEAALGFVARADSFVEPILERILTTEQLIPPAVVGAGAGDTLLFIRARTPSGHVIHQSDAAFDVAGYSATTELPPSGGSLILDVSLSPTAVRRLVVRNGEGTRLPIIAVLFIVTAALVAMAVVQLRRQENLVAGQLAEARLGALRMQLHPHFLFNCLNAITVLVRDGDTGTASRMLELLSGLLRRTLRQDAAHEVMLQEELDFLEQYLGIEQVRFSDRLQVAVTADSEARHAAVPVFLLQPLVENAIRHGISRRGDAGSIEIAARREGARLIISVRDDGAGPDAAALKSRGAGVGLSNTRERLRNLYGAGAGVDLDSAPGGGAVATVWLPFRSAPSSSRFPKPVDRTPVHV